MDANMINSENQWSEVTEDYGGGGGVGGDKMSIDETAGLDELMALNITNLNELDCLFNFLRAPYPPYSLPDHSAPISFCNSTWDGVTCWPTTLAGSTSVLPCVDELNGIKYDTARKSMFPLLICSSSNRAAINETFLCVQFNFFGM